MGDNYSDLDYRKLPADQLNNNIPEGRGMIKWAPFATMPEQFENINHMIESQSHLAEPYLTEDLLQELELKLRELLNCNVILRYWHDGYEHQIECRIEHIDNWSMVVTVSKSVHLIHVEFGHIYSVDKYDYLAQE